MDIRSFQGKDAMTVLHLWNLAHPQYPLTEELLAKKIFLDPNFLPENLLIAEENGEAVAFAYLPYHLSKPEQGGFITYFSVHPHKDRAEIGKSLLQACEQHHRQAGRLRVSTAYTPLYHLQGFSESYDGAEIELFRSFGYTEMRSYRRRMSLADYALSVNYTQRKAQLEEEGFYIGPLPYEYLSEFVSPVNAYSSAAWASEYRTRLANNPDLSKAGVAIYDGRIVGGCIFSDPNSDDCRFGPFGVSAEFRGKGLGAVLFAWCMAEMKKRGLPCAWAQWTPAEGASYNLYENTGFEIEDSFLILNSFEDRR